MNPTIVILLAFTTNLLMASCQSAPTNSLPSQVHNAGKQAPWIEQSFVFENGFRGPFHLVNDETKGSIRPVREGVVIEEIPADGILLIKTWGWREGDKRSLGDGPLMEELKEKYKYLENHHPELLRSRYRDGTVLPHRPVGRPNVVGVWVLGGWLPAGVMKKATGFEPTLDPTYHGPTGGGETGFVGTEAELHQYIREHCPDMKHILPENRTNP